MSPFKVNYGQDPRMEFKGRKKKKYQGVEKFIEKMKKISSNTVELELPSIIKIHPVVNVSKIHRYVGQVERQKKKQPALVIIKGEEEQEIERILNK